MSKASATVHVIVISGSMGSGKTTVLGEASDLLIARNTVHAAIDFDFLAIVHPPEGAPDDVRYRNLASVWQNYAAIGVRRLLLAEAIERRADVERIHAAIPDSEMVVCRLKASLDTLRQRVAVREPGMRQSEFVARAEELDEVLDAAGVEDFSIVNERRSVTDVAREMLARAGWLDRVEDR
jgi:ABC-type lipoprotein export system ATPase subunit